jgi:hypothetical protein
MTLQNTSSPTKGVIYYSNGIAEPIKSLVWDSIIASGLPVQVDENSGNGGYPQMIRQIIDCLEEASTNIVFFTEHDVIYNPTHFEFTPERDDVFYYNENVWRWDYPKERYFTYDRLISLSGMCCYRELALTHFKNRLAKIQELGQDKPHRGEPEWLRKMGYEPGTKQPKRGGFWTEEFETWRSERPLIDIRHDKTFSPRKVELKDFKHKPTGWREQNERP